MRGQVLQSWDDYDVEIDKPFGVQRVMRMWIFGYTSTFETIEVDGEKRDIAKQKFAFYELAVIASKDRPLPQPGEMVQAQGRFLKIQRYKIRDDFMFNRGSFRDEDRPLSDSSYFKFIVANDLLVEERSESTIGMTLKIFFWSFLPRS